jgi:hypothetical protein
MNPDAEKLKAMNSWDNKTRAFDQITQMLRKTADPGDAWSKVLEITEQSDILLLRAACPLPDIQAASAALGALFASKPPPRRLSFFYFGLLDLWNEREQKEKAGLYIVGRCRRRSRLGKNLLCAPGILALDGIAEHDQRG